MAFGEEVKGLGPQLMEALAGIGRAYGEKKRADEAQQLVSQIFSKAMKSRDPYDLMSGETASLFAQLNRTPEGQEAGKSVQQQMGFGKVLDDLRKSQITGVGPDQDLGTPIYDERGNPIAFKNFYENPRTRYGVTKWTDLTPEERTKFEVGEVKSFTETGPGGAKVTVRRYPKILRKSDGSPVTNQSGEPILEQEEKQTRLPNVPTGGGKNKYTTHIEVPTATGNVSQRNITGKTYREIHQNLLIEAEALSAQALRMGPKDTSLWQDIKSIFNKSKNPDWKEIETAQMKVRNLPQGDVLKLYVDDWAALQSKISSYEKLANEEEQSAGTTTTGEGSKPAGVKPKPRLNSIKRK